MEPLSSSTSETENASTVDSISTHSNPKQFKKKKKRLLKKPISTPSSKGLRAKSRNGEVDAIALPLGMSIAVFVSQVLDRNNVSDERMATDNLSLVCTSAVKESLANVFGDKFDPFVKNFGESFRCTLKTLRLVNKASLSNGEPVSESSTESMNSEASLGKGEGVHSCRDGVNAKCSQITCHNEYKEDQINSPFKSSVCQSSSVSEHKDDPSCTFKSTMPIPDISVICKSLGFVEEMHDQICYAESSVCQSASLGRHKNDPSSCAMPSAAIPTVSGSCRSLDCDEELHENVGLDAIDQELASHGIMNQQLACVAPKNLGSGLNDSVMSTFEKSVTEQARSNNLKVFEIGLKMKELQLKESQLALSSDSNRLDRYKLSLNISKASFKEERFKNQLEETRHAELLQKCIDCLIFGLITMSASLMYGAYVYSYKRISELTTSCGPSPEESKSWWMPKKVALFNSAWHTISCNVVVWSRILFGLCMILAIAYLLLQRSPNCKQMMPVTQIVLILGFMCGIAGKFCVDTLGGSGYKWLIHWEALCFIHFLANICTSTFFLLLHGPVFVSQGHHTKSRLPYWLRRFVFYAVVLVLPICCGLMPFAGPGDWKDHIVSLGTNMFYESAGVEGSLR